MENRLLFSSVFPKAVNGVVHLVEDIKQQNEIHLDLNVIIKSAAGKKEKCKIHCYRLISEGKKIELHNIIFEGSLILRNDSQFYAEDCDFSRGDTGSGGIITQKESCSRIKNSVFHDSDTDGFFSEFSPKLHFENCNFRNIKRSCINSYETADFKVFKCMFKEIKHNEQQTVCCIKANQGDMIVVRDSSFSKCNGSCIKVIGANVLAEGCSFSDADETSINLESTVFRIQKCKFTNLSSSAISVRESRSDTYNNICENTFSYIDGNCILSDDSNVNICENIMLGLKYPSVAVLNKSTAFISKNTIEKCEKSGLCIRNGGPATVRENKISSVAEAGISVSDSQDINIVDNVIENCENASLESYNESVVTAKGNKIIDCGLYVFSAYALGRLNAYNNIINSPRSVLLNISTKGYANIEKNKIRNVSKVYEGKTKGIFTIADNEGVNNITNDENLAKSKGYNFVSFADYQAMKCINCGKNDINGAFVPCGHMLYCEGCCKGMEKDSSCPLCRFPIQRYVLKFYGNRELCGICDTNVPDSFISPCGHIACQTCLSEWFKTSNTCPICRISSCSHKKLLSFE